MVDFTNSPITIHTIMTAFFAVGIPITEDKARAEKTRIRENGVTGVQDYMLSDRTRLPVALTRKQRKIIGEHIASNMRTTRPRHVTAIPHGPDYEGAILEEQERRFGGD